MTLELNVTANEKFVGTLSFDPGASKFSFSYAPDWLVANEFLLSPRLIPEVCAGENSHFELSTFLGNLLPEGSALDDVAAAARLSKQNLFGLLRYLGRETAGALALQDPAAAATPQEPCRRHLTCEELSKRIHNRDQIPFSVWDGKVRLSIAGHQDKIAVLKDGADLFLVDGTLASTHILKPPPRNQNIERLVINEYFCMRLAQAVKLPVAEVELIRVPEPVLLIKRFDREWLGDDHVRRIHIIDGCQALGLPAGYKYERNLGSGQDVKHIRDGASLIKLFGLARHVHNKAAGLLAMLRWTLFQYLIGNSDAHGKNISFFVQGNALVQTKAYDLVCVEAHPEFEQEAAMAIGDTFAYDQVGAFDWAQFAAECGLKRILVAREMKSMAESVRKVCAVPADPVYLQDDLDYLDPIVALIRRRADAMIAAAKEVPKVAPDLL